jgi:transposase
MAKGYRPVDRDQPFLLPPDMREWLPASHPVWLVIAAVGQLDTSAFHARRRTGGAGAAGYDPDMLVTLLIWAHANGLTSSRRIERLCGQDIAFRVICAGDAPDHVTVARFRQQFAETAASLFAEVLVLCARLGMGKVGVVALDGAKIGANAPKDANRTEAGLRKLAEEMAAAHAEADAEDDALFGEGRRGGDDPGDPFTRPGRVAAALAGLQAGREAREAAERAAAREHPEAARDGALPPQGRPARARRPPGPRWSGRPPPARPGSGTGSGAGPPASAPAAARSLPGSPPWSAARGSGWRRPWPRRPPARRSRSGSRRARRRPGTSPTPTRG